MAIDQLSPQYQNTAVGTETRNRVLRNTYGLLALSMIPTVIGAWIGVATRFKSSGWMAKPSTTASRIAGASSRMIWRKRASVCAS